MLICMPVFVPGPTTTTSPAVISPATSRNTDVIAGTTELICHAGYVVAGELLEVEQVAQPDLELVRRARRHSRQPPMRRELVAVVEADRSIRVADVGGEQHGRGFLDVVRLGVQHAGTLQQNSAVGNERRPRSTSRVNIVDEPDVTTPGRNGQETIDVDRIQPLDIPHGS